MNHKPTQDPMDEYKLDSAGQNAVRKLVQALPDDAPSMAWRSSLNERLLATAVDQKKKKRWTWVLKPALGLSLAMGLGFVLIFQPSHRTHLAPAVKPGIESAILADHHNSSLLNEVSSAGLNANETVTEANSEDPEVGLWSESDVESL